MTLERPTRRQAPPHPPASPATSAAGPVWRELRRRFGEGKAALAPGAWRAWLRTVALGVVGLLLLMVALMLVARRLVSTGRLDWETAFLLRLGEDGPLSFADAVFFQTFGTDITLVFLVAATAGIACWLRRPITALSIVIAPVVVDLVGRFGWAIWARTRPDVLHDGVASPGFHSFPSGHTSKTTALYGLLTLLWVAASRSVLERAVALLILGFILVVVPLGRMSMGVHWPSDIAGGFVLGAAWVAVLRYGLRFERTALESREREPPGRFSTPPAPAPRHRRR